jgi:type III secretion protein J
LDENIFKKTGLVSSPLEERVRFMHALSEKLSETISHIHGVVTARVHIILPENDPYSEKLIPPSASVFISYLPHVNVEESVKDIKQLVTNSIEGLSSEKVTMVLFPNSPPQERLPLSMLQEKMPIMKS